MCGGDVFMLFDIEKAVRKGYKKRRRTPEWLGPFGEIIRTVDYITSDQEAEGRQYAVEFAYELYGPIFRTFEQIVSDARLSARIQVLEFNSAVSILCIKYDEYQSEISKLEDEMTALMDRDNALALFREHFSNHGAPSIIADYSRFSINLDDKMEAKRRKYFEIELCEQVRMMESKLAELHKELSQIFDQIESLRDDERCTLCELQGMVDQLEKEYLNKKLEYKLLKDVLGH